MRTIILSDITEETPSIIPYGLNVAKYAETRVEILQYSDPKLVQGTYSPISDSQSITPGEKLSYEQILHRETEIAKEKLDRLLSREASRLNYPLRINTIAEITDPEKAIADKLDEFENVMVITSTNPSHSMASGLDDVLTVLQKLNTRILIIPAGKKFIKPAKCCLVTDLSKEASQNLENLFSWINPLAERIYTSAVIHNESGSNSSQQIEQWQQALKAYSQFLASDSTEVVRIDEPDVAFENICRHKRPDMVVYPKNGKSYFSRLLFSEGYLRNFSEMLNIPVLLY